MAAKPLPSEGSVSAWFHHTGEMLSRLGRSTNALRVARVNVPTTGSCRCVEFQSRTRSREALDGKMGPPLGFAPSSSRYQRDASLSRLRRHGPGGRNCTSVVPKDGWVTANCDCCSATPGWEMGARAGFAPAIFAL